LCHAAEGSPHRRPPVGGRALLGAQCHHRFVLYIYMSFVMLLVVVMLVVSCSGGESPSPPTCWRAGATWRSVPPSIRIVHIHVVCDVVDSYDVGAVMQRMGVPMAAHLLEGGRYLVLWPEHQPLMANGCAFAVDSYSNGDLISAAEVKFLYKFIQ
jgi:hypothetical protein